MSNQERDEQTTMPSSSNRCTLMKNEVENSFTISCNSTIFQTIQKAVAQFAEIDLGFYQTRIQSSALALFEGLFTEMCQKQFHFRSPSLSSVGFDVFCLGLELIDLKKDLSDEFAADFFCAFSTFISRKTEGKSLNRTEFLRWISESTASAGAFFFAALWLSCKFWCSRLYQVPLGPLLKVINSSTFFSSCSEAARNTKESRDSPSVASSPRFLTEEDIRTCEMILLRSSKYVVPIVKTKYS